MMAAVDEDGEVGVGHGGCGRKSVLFWFDLRSFSCGKILVIWVCLSLIAAVFMLSTYRYSAGIPRYGLRMGPSQDVR